MNEEVLRKELRTFVDSRKKVRLTRSIPSEVKHNGFVLGVGQEWILLQQFHDFYPEGYTVLRIKDIIKIRSGEYERHWERMLAEERILEQIRPPGDVPLENLSHLLKALQERGENVIIECENEEEEIEDFYIGQILSVDEDSLCFANFDALGRWDEEIHTILFEEITKVQFDTPYVRIFSKYLNGPCPHKNRQFHHNSNI